MFNISGFELFSLGAPESFLTGLCILESLVIIQNILDYQAYLYKTEYQSESALICSFMCGFLKRLSIP